MKRLAMILAPAALALTLGSGAAFAHSHSLPFKSSGSGTQVAGGPPGCQFLGNCTITTSGNEVSSHLGAGTYTSTLTLDYMDVTRPAPDVYCVPVTGPSTITAANGDQLFLTTTGAVCGGNEAGAVHTLNGTYTITGGTGRFSGATGSGTESGSDDGGANSSYSLSGTINY